MTMTMNKRRCMTFTESYYLIFRCMMAAAPMRECYRMEESAADEDMGGLFGDDYGGEEMEEEADYKP